MPICKLNTLLRNGDIFMKKVLRNLVCIVLSIFTIVSFTSCSTNKERYNENLETNEVVNTLVDLALEETDLLLDEYIDVDYFITLKYSTEESVLI